MIPLGLRRTCASTSSGRSLAWVEVSAGYLSPEYATAGRRALCLRLCPRPWSFAAFRPTQTKLTEAPISATVQLRCSVRSRSPRVLKSAGRRSRTRQGPSAEDRCAGYRGAMPPNARPFPLRESLTKKINAAGKQAGARSRPRCRRSSSIC